MMNDTQQEPALDADGRALGPTAEVRVVRVTPEELRATIAAQSQRPAPAPDLSRAARTSKPRPVRKRRRAAARVQRSESPLERHARKCAVCQHSDRDEIEELFLHWHAPGEIAYDFKLPLRSLYRHAHTTGLYEARQGELRSVLDRILEKASHVAPTGDAIIRAVRAYTCLSDNNKWVEPASRVIFSSANPTRTGVPSESAAADESMGGSINASVVAIHELPVTNHQSHPNRHTGD
jgi:hypothetical protein